MKKDSFGSRAVLQTKGGSFTIHRLDALKKAGVARGRLRVALDPSERHTALTINEYETLLMKYDLAEVLRTMRRSPVVLKVSRSRLS